jgi:site-specific recombinase XerC
MKDKGYQTMSLGEEAVDYLRYKQKRLTPASQREYESCLDKFVRKFHGLELFEFEPPRGMVIIEQFLTSQWGGQSASSYNKSLSILKDFFEWQFRLEKLQRNPCMYLERMRKKKFFRTTFSDRQRYAIFFANPSMRDQIALRLLLSYGIRKGTLQKVKFEHFDHDRLQIILHAKGQKVHQIPLPEEYLWNCLEDLIEEQGSLPQHFLMPRQITRKKRPSKELASDLQGLSEELLAVQQRCESMSSEMSSVLLTRLQEATEDCIHSSGMITRDAWRITITDPLLGMGEHGLHNWWYRCLQRAKIVPEGVWAGERMHKARHSAAQRVLNKTGNIRAAQRLLGHESLSTTEEYVDWDIDQLAETMALVVGDSRGGRQNAFA